MVARDPVTHPGARVATTATWMRRLSSGPWHLKGLGLGKTSCGRKLTGELENTTATADGPSHTRGVKSDTTCRACRDYAHQPKGA